MHSYEPSGTAAVAAYAAARGCAGREGGEDIMPGKLTKLLCIFCLLLPTASLAGPGIGQACGDWSGTCSSHSAGKSLTSVLGRCAGSHVLERATVSDKGTGAGGFENATLGFPAGTASVGLQSNYPNPLNPVTSLVYSVKAASGVALRVYDVRGELVRTLLDERVSAGEHVVQWDGTNARGIRVTSGIYFVRLETEWGIFSRKLIVSR